MTAGEKVVLTRHDRKDRLGHGGVKAVAEELGVDAALVSRVVNDKQRHAGVEAAVARRVIRDESEIAFPPRDDAAAVEARQ
jgi:DNA-binding LacI/PurR family transcriptional regulator